MDRMDLQVENSGNNKGVMVAENNGNIFLSMVETKRIPSLISKIVQTLGTVCLDDDEISKSNAPEVFRVDEKIEYNAVLRYREIINEYAIYYDLCEQYLDIYDNSNIRGKKRILKCVKLWYLEEKGHLLDKFRNAGLVQMDIIRENSDCIIDAVKKRICDTVIQDMNEEYYIEDLEIGVACFTCYCFMKCKILEKPK
jgi:hypothetical protein